MTPVDQYVRAIRNRGKRLYAIAYLAWIRAGSQGEPPSHGLSAMAAQAVRPDPEPGSAAMMTFWIAELETRNFHFEAFAESRDAAISALARGLAAHGRQYKLAPRWFDEFEEDVTVHQVAVGACYRDHQEISK